MDFELHLAVSLKPQTPGQVKPEDQEPGHSGSVLLRLEMGEDRTSAQKLVAVHFKITSNVMMSI